MFLSFLLIVGARRHIICEAPYIVRMLGHQGSAQHLRHFQQHVLAAWVVSGDILGDLVSQ